MKHIARVLLLASIVMQTVFPATDRADAHRAIDSVNTLPYQYLMINLYRSINLLSSNAAEAEKLGYTAGAGSAYANLAKVLYLNGKYEQSTTNYLKAITIFENNGDPDALSDAYGEFGYQLKRTDMDKANAYLRAGIAIAEANHLDRNLSKLYDNYGVVKEMENRIDSAMFYYTKALRIKEEKKDSVGIPYSLNKLAGAYLLQNNYARTFEFLKRSDTYRMREVSDFGRIENLTLYGEVYSRMNRVDSAIAKYSAGLSLAKKVGVNYAIRVCYEALTNLFKRKGDYQKAFENYTLLTSYQDSVLNKEVRVNVAQLELDYETEKKDHDIALSRLEIQEKTTQIYSLFGVTVVIVVFGFFAYSGQKKKRMREKKELELSSRLKHAELENKNAEDKLRISRELHDNIGSQITVIISSLDNYIYGEGGTHAAGKLSRLSAYGRETLKELRNTIWALKHEDAELQELVLKINEFTRMIGENNSINIALDASVAAPVRLSSIQMLNMYRIVQEALQNTIKYAQARNVRISFTDNGRGFDLVVRDDGIGFDTRAVTGNNGLGNMKFRCEESGGVFMLRSSDEGTVVSCSFTL